MIAHLINTDAGDRGLLPVYLDYRKRNPGFLTSSVETFLNNLERILIITGFPIPPSMTPETDGPPGAVALAGAVELLGGRAEILTYPEVMNALRPFGINFVKSPDVGRYSLVIAVETPGRAADGKYYSMRGLEIGRESFDGTVIEARELGIPTIGIGDGGNEAGMGRIRELIERYVPHGEKIASVVETDELILSAVSNWGAYGLVALASMKTGRNLLENWDERAIIGSLVERGLVDGVTGERKLGVDGIPVEIHATLVGLLQEIVSWRNGTTRVPAPPSSGL
ncbi:glutamate cyclase domain-containing protein [Thermococcus sp.]|uniref:DUF4392 domain-containing protein n=1 Tax=Thermococcus sp. TaxID=35749 RepID=UPI0026137A6B|nr:glutamate cyclase domain-containing protein [Thermococcus sp.]